MQIMRTQKEFVKRFRRIHFRKILVQRDTLLLADIFENFRNMCLVIHELDSADFFFFSWISMTNSFNPIWHLTQGGWPGELYFILIKLIFTRSSQIWINFLQRVMRYDLFVKERCNISRISETNKKPFICIFLKHHNVPNINNLLLIPDLFVIPMMTCLWRHYWLNDALWHLNKQKRCFAI